MSNSPPPPTRSGTSRLDLGHALRLVWEADRRWTLANAVLFAIQGALPLAFLYLIKRILDVLADDLGAADPEAAFRRVLPLLLMVAATAFATILLNALSELANTALSQTVTDHMFGVLHGKAVELELAHYESSRSQDILRRAEREAPFRPTRVVQGLRQLLQNGVSVVAIGGLMLTLHWWIAALVVLLAIPAVLVRLRFIDKMYRWTRRRTSTERKAHYYHSMVTSLWYAKEIRLFGLGARFLDQFKQLRTRMREELVAIAARRAAAGFGAQAAAGLVVLGVYAFLVDQTVRGTLTLGDLALYHQAFQKGRNAIAEMLSSLAGLYESNLFLSDLYELLDLEPTIVDPPMPVAVPRPQRRGVVFEHVAFRYPGSERPVLEDVDLTLAPGETIALVGRNGAGKTSLVKLLCRLYDPTAGRITVDGIDLRDLAVRDWRREIAVVFQDYARFQLSARENVGFGDLEHLGDDHRIRDAARRADIDALLHGLPHGYDTTLGKWFEGGEELSLGEWQKVALARAFLRDAGIVVLDEPTSALDPHAEDEILHQFHELIAGRSAILVSHRMTTVQAADCIYVLDGGRIVERGDHASLVRLGGCYAELFETQVKWHR